MLGLDATLEHEERTGKVRDSVVWPRGEVELGHFSHVAHGETESDVLRRLHEGKEIFVSTGFMQSS